MSKIYILLAVILFFGSCETEPRGKPSASGRTSEMVVIMDNNQWEGEPGELVRHTFSAAQPMLPQQEPMFDLRPIKRENFSNLFETHRNILDVVLDETLEDYRVETREDVWSYPQRVVRIYAPNVNELDSVLLTHEERLIELYLENERRRLINSFEMMSNPDVRNKLRDRYEVELKVPEGYFLAKEKENFAWVRRAGVDQDLEMGLLLTILPYTDPDKDFDFDVIWSRRDSITKEHIPGELPDSYMTTYEEDDFPPLKREIDFKGRYAVELRGLWKMHGDFMGGPFVNYTMVDEDNDRLINLDVFVWAPDFDKRDYIRQLEALVYSLEFPEEEEEVHEEEELAATEPGEL